MRKEFLFKNECAKYITMTVNTNTELHTKLLLLRDFFTLNYQSFKLHRFCGLQPWCQ